MTVTTRTFYRTHFNSAWRRQLHTHSQMPSLASPTQRDGYTKHAPTRALKTAPSAIARRSTFSQIGGNGGGKGGARQNTISQTHVAYVLLPLKRCASHSLPLARYQRSKLQTRTLVQTPLPPLGHVPITVRDILTNIRPPIPVHRLVGHCICTSHVCKHL